MSVARPHWLSRLAVTLTLALLGVALVGLWPAIAQRQQGRVRTELTPKEAQAVALERQGKLLTARRLADEILAEDPDSLAGHFVLAKALHEAEGSLARAMFHMKRAAELHERAWPRGSGDEVGLDWHRRIYFELQGLAGEMERYDLQLDYLDDVREAAPEFRLADNEAWAHLRLGDMERARAAARIAIGSTWEYERQGGLNALCAIEYSDHNRQACYDACLAALDGSRGQRAAGNRESVVVDASNAAEAAQSVLRFDEAERYIREAADPPANSATNPWRFLTLLMLDQGRMDEAIEGLKAMQRWRMGQSPDLRVHAQAEADMALAVTLLVGARAEDAFRMADRALSRPDRRGFTSNTPEQALGGHALIRRAIRRLDAELIAEEASWSSLGDRVGAVARASGRRLGAWPDDERVIHVLTDPKRLHATFRVYAYGTVDAPVWLLGDLVEVLGPGVVGAVLEQARAAEQMPGLHAYYDGFEAEVALAQGEHRRALDLAQRALADLPHSERLVRARVAAVGAEGARRAGDLAAAMPLFEQAMQGDPGVVRRLGLALPATVEVASSQTAARHAGDLLERSPRLRETPGGFRVSVEDQGAGLRACLVSPAGGIVGCATGEPAPADSDDPIGDAARGLARAFHAETFAMPMNLSATDLRSLDGTTALDAEAARERMNRTLDELMAP